MPAPMPHTTRPHSPAAARNQAPILDQLLRLLPPQGTALELASGTGQHAAHFAGALPQWQWQPSDGDAHALPGIAAWCQALPNVRPPLQLDVLAGTWPGAPDAVHLVYCANLLHIAPWSTCAALMRGAARHLAPSGLLVLYGPYLEAEVPTAPGNLAFDAELQSRDAAWGLRRLDARRSASCRCGSRRPAARSAAPRPGSARSARAGRCPGAGR